MKINFAVFGIMLAILAGCSVFRGYPARDVQLVAVGDSIMAWNRKRGVNVPIVVSALTGLPLFDASIVGAKFVGRLDIRTQYPEGEWDWLIMNGGGNDLLGSCVGLTESEIVLDRLIDDVDLSGAYADFLMPIIAVGTQVIILGYAPVSIAGGPFAVCQNALTELSARQWRLADSDPNITFVDVRDVIFATDLSAYAPDRIHPSIAGGALMAEKIASVINAQR